METHSYEGVNEPSWVELCLAQLLLVTQVLGSGLWRAWGIELGLGSFRLRWSQLSSQRVFRCTVPKHFQCQVSQLDGSVWYMHCFGGGWLDKSTESIVVPTNNLQGRAMTLSANIVIKDCSKQNLSRLSIQTTTLSSIYWWGPCKRLHPHLIPATPANNDGVIAEQHRLLLLTLFFLIFKPTELWLILFNLPYALPCWGLSDIALVISGVEFKSIHKLWFKI